jgi:hypothetical protein
MGLDDFEVFTDFTYTTATEILQQQLDMFNAATNGALILQPGNNRGDFVDKTMYAKIADLVRRRNVYGNGSISDKELEMLLNTSVKVAAGTPPVRLDPAWWRWIGENPDQAGVVYGTQLAVDMAADMLNTAIRAAVAAMVNDEAVIENDVSATGDGTADFKGLLGAAAKFGDQAQKIRCWVAHSKVMFDIWGTAIDNDNALFTFGTINVRTDGFGRPIVVTDSPSLVNTSATPDEYYTLGLTAGAVVVEQNDDFDQNTDTRNGFENIRRTIQSEWSYNLSVKGYAWDKDSGGHSPNDAAIGSSGSWDRFVTSDKDLPGVILLSK